MRIRLGMLLAVLALPLAVLGKGRPVNDSAPRRYVQQATVEEGVSYRNMTVFPVDWSGAGGAPLMSLQAGLRNHEVVISEIGEGEVNELYVENLSKTPVFIMAGEILVGAKQNRVLQSDMIVPPLSGKMRVSAFCVEHGRWTYESSNRDFAPSDYISNPSVRAEAQVTKSQSAVWDKVADTNAKARSSGGTGALTQAYNAPQMKGDLDGYVHFFANIPSKSPQMRGAVIAIGDRILVADTFSQRGLMTDVWEKLVRSYALEAAQQGNVKPVVGSGQARAFLDRMLAANLQPQTTPGLGQLFDVTGGGMSGSVLVYDNAPVHMALYPQQLVTPPLRPSDDGEQPYIQRQYPR